MNTKKIFLVIVLLLIIISLFFVMYIINNKNRVENKNQDDNKKEYVDEDSNKENESNIEITDNFFMAKMEDIYMNYEKYEGKTVSYDGFVYYDLKNPDVMVIARYYYCCGYDSYIEGLECKYDGKLPEKDKWVHVKGIIKINRDNESDIYPYLEITSMDYLKTPGNKYVKS